METNEDANAPVYVSVNVARLLQQVLQKRIDLLLMYK